MHPKKAGLAPGKIKSNYENPLTLELLEKLRFTRNSSKHCPLRIPRNYLGEMRAVQRAD
jgi:hypothetical protein